MLAPNLSPRSFCSCACLVLSWVSMNTALHQNHSSTWGAVSDLGSPNEYSCRWTFSMLTLLLYRSGHSSFAFISSKNVWASSFKSFGIPDSPSFTVFCHKWPFHDLVFVIPPPPLIKVASNIRPCLKLGGTSLNGREEGGQYYNSQTFDQERFEARKVIFSGECLNIFATGRSKH